MKVAYLFSRYPVPSQTFCDTEIRALEDAGIDVEIWSISPPPNSFRHEASGRPRRAAVHYLPPPPALEVWESAARRLGTWPAEMVAAQAARYGAQNRPERRALHAVYLMETLRRRGVEHLHVHFTNHATHVAAFMRAMGGVPYSFTAHAQDFLVDLGNDDLLREMCERASFVVAVSNFSRDLLVGKCPAAAAKIHRVYNGLPLEQWNGPIRPAASEDGGRGGTLRIFSVGRLIEFKGFGRLVESCALLRDRGILFECEIAGDGPLHSALADLIDSTGLADRVRLLGLRSQEEIRRGMAACDVFALACRVDEAGACDVLPTVILEAMGAARPVVSTRLAGVPEMVDDGRTGLLVAPDDPAAFADALTTLAAQPALRTRLGLAGRAKIAERFAAADTSRQLAGLLRASRREDSAAADAPAPVTGTPAPSAIAAGRDGMGVACLLAQWSVNGVAPESGLSNFALLHLHSQMRGVRFVTLQTNAVTTAERTARPLHPLTEIVARTLEYYPDAIVLEAEWREQGSLAHQLESWRKELGNGFRTEDFLLAARRALYFHRQMIVNRPVRHLHAVGAGALLPAWLLLRLGSVESASFLLPSMALPAGGALPESALRRLAPRFAHGWVAGKRKLAESLGPAVHGGDLPANSDGWQLWTTTLRGWTEKV